MNDHIIGVNVLFVDIKKFVLTLSWERKGAKNQPTGSQTMIETFELYFNCLFSENKQF